jgi:hypothetical protein
LLARFRVFAWLFLEYLKELFPPLSNLVPFIFWLLVRLPWQCSGNDGGRGLALDGLFPDLGLELSEAALAPFLIGLEVLFVDSLGVLG